MKAKIGYTNLQALMITLLTVCVSMAFGWHMAQILLAYVSASVGLFVLYALDFDDQNQVIWPYTELCRWMGVLILMVMYVAKG